MFCFRRGPFNLPRVGRKRARPNVCHINQTRALGECVCVCLCVCLRECMCEYAVGGDGRVAKDREK